jgi:hypothetical protein
MTGAIVGSWMIPLVAAIAIFLPIRLVQFFRRDRTGSDDRNC